jgi:hypothetical protein
MIYIPRNWVMLKVSSKEYGVFYKVLASWGDSWKLSSGTTSMEYTELGFKFPQISNSEYICHRHCYGLSLYTANILHSFTKDLDGTDYTVELLDEQTDWASITYA